MTEIIGKQPDFTRPVLFLDFDDVINIFNDYVHVNPTGLHRETVVIPKGTHRPGGGPIPEDKKMPLLWDDEVVNILRGLNAVWISSWKHLTQNLLNPVLGFDFGYADWHYRGFSNPSHDGKRLAVEEIVEHNRIPAFVVADDSFFSGEADMIVGVDGMIVSPRYDGNGLIKEDALEIKAFMETEHVVPFCKMRFRQLQEDGYSGRIYCVAYLDKTCDDIKIEDPFYCFETPEEVRIYLECKNKSGIRDSRDFSDRYRIAVAFIDLQDGEHIHEGVDEYL